MKRQRNTQQVKEQDKCPQNQTKEEQIGNLSDKEFQIMIVKMIQNLENKMESQINSPETRIEKMQERFNKDPFNITVIQVYAPTSNAEETEGERFYEDLQDLLELTPKKDVRFIIGDWNAKVGSQETHGVIGKFGFGMWNESGKRLIEFYQENALVTPNTLFQQDKRRLYT